MDYKSIDFENEAQIEALIEDCGYVIRKTEHDEGREAETLPLEDLHLSQESVAFLRKRNITNPWKHQHLAIQKVKEGKNACITTSTSSGKTEIFQLSCMEILHKDPTAKVLAVYPMKALNTQQLERWQNTGLTVGKIQGGVELEDRLKALECDVVVITPDTIHAFLLTNLNSRRCGAAIQNFISHIAVIVVDELHLYKGYFGTNCAYLFRRLNNVRRHLRNDRSFPLYITASATLPSATEHSYNITGAKDFIEIGKEVDGSPVSKRTTYYVERRENVSNASVGNMVKAFADIETAKSITFVDGRQQTGTIAKDASTEDIGETIKECEESGIYPYRAGYEVETANAICQKLNGGKFKGVISTSALEIGIDIERVNVVIVNDLPQDYNSYCQRIGRAGRYGCDKSYVIVVRGISLASNLLFESNDFDVEKVLPCYVPALYLEDRHIQAIHAYLHIGCEMHEDPSIDKQRGLVQKFNATDYFPPYFVEFCNDVLGRHKMPAEYRTVVNSSVEPHRKYQVRFFGTQYPIVAADGVNGLPDKELISREQMATEGYQGAIRHTMRYDANTRKAKPVVERIMGNQGRGDNTQILARKANRAEEFGRTKANARTYLFPILTADARHSSLTYGRTTFLNLNADEERYIYGYAIAYPKCGFKPIPYDFPQKLPSYHTTATVIFHPSFNKKDVSPADIAEILLKTFFLRNAFDSQDIKKHGGRLHGYNEMLGRNPKFVSFYDVTPFNLTLHLTEEQTLHDLFKFLRENEDTIIRSVCPYGIKKKTREALDEVIDDVLNNVCDSAQVEVGPTHRLKKGTDVLYAPIAQSEDSTKEDIPALFIEYDSEDYCTAHIRLLVPPMEHKYEVPIDSIHPTDTTEYE